MLYFGALFRYDCDRGPEVLRSRLRSRESARLQPLNRRLQATDARSQPRPGVRLAFTASMPYKAGYVATYTVA